jgi:hypothetical protein
VKLWFTRSVSTFVAVETEEPAPVTETTFFLVPENTFTCPSTIPKYVKGWARRGSAKKKETKNLFIEDIISLTCASEEYVPLLSQFLKDKYLKGCVKREDYIFALRL